MMGKFDMQTDQEMRRASNAITIEDGLKHIYKKKNYRHGAIYILCKGWVKAKNGYWTGKRWKEYHGWSIEFKENRISQASIGAGHLSNCPSCLKLYVPIFNRIHSKFTTNLASMINNVTRASE